MFKFDSFNNFLFQDVFDSQLILRIIHEPFVTDILKSHGSLIA